MLIWYGSIFKFGWSLKTIENLFWKLKRNFSITYAYFQRPVQNIKNNFISNPREPSKTFNWMIDFHKISLKSIYWAEKSKTTHPFQLNIYIHNKKTLSDFKYNLNFYIDIFALKLKFKGTYLLLGRAKITLKIERNIKFWNFIAKTKV